MTELFRSSLSRAEREVFQRVTSRYRCRFVRPWLAPWCSWSSPQHWAGNPAGCWPSFVNSISSINESNWKTEWLSFLLVYRTKKSFEFRQKSMNKIWFLVLRNISFFAFLLLDSKCFWERYLCVCQFFSDSIMFFGSGFWLQLEHYQS